MPKSLKYCCLGLPSSTNTGKLGCWLARAPHISTGQPGNEIQLLTDCLINSRSFTFNLFILSNYCSSPSGILSLSALSFSSVYLGHDNELHWFNESRAHMHVCVCVFLQTTWFYVKRLPLKLQLCQWVRIHDTKPHVTLMISVICYMPCWITPTHH